MGGTCDQETGQCQCLEGVIGQNCDHCPDGWVLVVNETRTIRPEWKRPFGYEEGCFPCPSCVGDLMDVAGAMTSALGPVSDEFRTAEASYFAYRRLQYIKDEVETLQPELQLLNPEEGSRRLRPLEHQIADQQLKAKSLNVAFKLDLMAQLQKGAEGLLSSGRDAVADTSKVRADMERATKDMKAVADGLGSGVTPDQLETSVQLGKEWLDSMKAHNFSGDRTEATAKRRDGTAMVEKVKAFAKPGADFRRDVATAEDRVAALTNRLDDLRNNSEKANEMVGWGIIICTCALKRMDGYIIHMMAPPAGCSSPVRWALETYACKPLQGLHSP